MHLFSFQKQRALLVCACGCRPGVPSGYRWAAKQQIEDESLEPSPLQMALKSIQNQVGLACAQGALYQWTVVRWY